MFAKYGPSGGVRVCLSRPAVSKANDLPWNLDNLSARLQPSRDQACTCSAAHRSLLLAPSRSPPLASPSLRYPSVSFRAAPLPTLHRGCPDPLLIVRPMPRAYQWQPRLTYDRAPPFTRAARFRSAAFGIHGARGIGNISRVNGIKPRRRRRIAERNCTPGSIKVRAEFVQSRSELPAEVKTNQG